MPTPSRKLSPVQQAQELPRTHESLLRLPTVMARTGKPKTDIYTDPTFPKPIKLNSGNRRNVRSAWLASEIDAWIAMRIRASRGPGPVDSEQAAS
jgi:prophage regulatory protein